MDSLWIDKYINELRPKLFDINEIKSELNKMIEEFNEKYNKRCKEYGIDENEDIAKINVLDDNLCKIHLPKEKIISFEIIFNPNIIVITDTETKERVEIIFYDNYYIVYNEKERVEEDSLLNALDKAIEIILRFNKE